MQSDNSLNFLPVRAGRNYAPVKPLLDIKSRESRAQSHDYLTDAFRERYQHKMREHKETFDDLNMVGQLTSLFIQGKQNLKWNGLTKNFYAAPNAYGAGGEDNLKVTPIMRFYLTNLESRYMSSNPDVSVLAGREDDKCVQAAKAAKIITDYYERRLYTNWFCRNECLMLASFGTQINRVRWDSQKKGFRAFRDVFEDREFPVSAGVGQCLACGHTGTGAEYLRVSASFASCPECESFNVYHEPPTELALPVKTGEERINLGDVTLEALEFPACRWDLRRKAEESSWFIYEQMSNMGIVRQLLGDVSIPDDKAGANSLGLEIVESLAAAGNPVGGKTNVREAQSSAFKEKVKVTEMYLSPEDYADIKIGTDEETLCGERLPKGAALTELFPEGLVAVGLSGMSVLLGVYAETHKKQLSTGVWHIKHFSGAGQGVSDSVELNRQLNETNSQGYLAMRHNATPATFFPEGAIEKEYLDYIGRPDVAIPINMENFPQARSVADIIASPRIGQIDAGILSYQEGALRNMMQLTMHTTNFSGGLPGVNNRTATGAQITEANANSLFTPMVGIKKDVRIRAAEMFVSLYRENVPVAQFFPLASRYGAQEGVYLSGADLDADLIFDAIENSELPRNSLSIREDNDRFMAAVGGAQGVIALQETKPEFLDELMRRYGVDLETNHSDEVAQICRQRFESAKNLLRQFSAAEAQAVVRLSLAAGIRGAGDQVIRGRDAQTGTDGIPGMMGAETGGGETGGGNNGAAQADFLHGQFSPQQFSQEQQLQATPEQSAQQSQMMPPTQQINSTQTADQSGQSAQTPAQPGQEAQPTIQPGQSEQGAPGATMPQQTPDPPQPPNPLTIQAEMIVENVLPPISEYEPLHRQSIDWFRNFLFTDEGRGLKKDERELIGAFIRKHIGFAANEAMFMAQIQAAVTGNG